jgi:hypothetical protein
MKRTATILVLLLLAGAPAMGAPIPKTLIAADAKWILHLDADQFRAGKVGTYFLEQLLEPKSAKAKADLKRELNFDLDWRRVHGITAYGSGYKPDNDTSGLLLIRTDLDVKSALEAAITRQAPELRVEKITDAAVPLYRLNDQAYVACESGGVLLVSKYRAAIDKGHAVIAGKSANLASATALSGYPDAMSGFFFLALAEGFGQNAQVPPNAAILKQAVGARVVLAEREERLRLILDIKAASADVASQIQQVAQGLLALATLNAEQNPDLKKLTQSAAVSTADTLVTLKLEVPVADVIEKMAEKK